MNVDKSQILQSQSTLSNPSQLKIIQSCNYEYVSTDEFVSLNVLANEESYGEKGSQGIMLLVPLYARVSSKSEELKYFQKGQKKDAHFEKMIVCLDPFADQGDNIVVFLLGNGHNSAFFNNCLKLRDSGGVAMGRGMFAIECPPAVTHRLSNDTNGPRMMNIVNSVVAVKISEKVISEHISFPSCRLPTHRIIENQADTQHGFVLHNCILKLTNLSFDEPTCTSNFCNCINCYDGGIKKAFCPCYARTTTKHPIVAVLDFNVIPPNGEAFPVRWFTSKSVTEYFFKGAKISNGSRASVLNGFRTRVSVQRCFNSIISYVNDGGEHKDTDILSKEELLQCRGWTVIGWVRRGNHADQALTQQGGTVYGKPATPQARAGALSHHVVSMYPSCGALLSEDTLESKRYDDSKSSNSTIVNRSASTNVAPQGSSRTSSAASVSEGNLEVKEGSRSKPVSSSNIESNIGSGNSNKKQKSNTAKKGVPSSVREAHTHQVLNISGEIDNKLDSEAPYV